MDDRRHRGRGRHREREGGWGGPRMRRGQIRTALLAVLAEAPGHGYDVMQNLEDKTGGAWRPSPGSVYPALQQLEDEGLIAATTGEGGRRAFQLTEEGRAYTAAHPDEVQAPWDVVAQSVGNEAIELRRLFGTVAMAGMQVARVGNRAQVEQARQILTDARRKLYQILAAEDDDQAADEPTDG